MTTQITMDRAGRVLIPKALREQLHLRPGDVLELESQGDDIKLKPQRGSATLVEEHGIPVFRTGGPADIDIFELIRQGREERHRRILSIDTE